MRRAWDGATTQGINRFLHEPQERLRVLQPRRRFLTIGPGPVLDDVEAPRPEVRKQRLEGSPRRLIGVGGVVYDQVERAVELASDDLA
jgi:hypothetical protein